MLQCACADASGKCARRNVPHSREMDWGGEALKGRCCYSSGVCQGMRMYFLG